MDTTTLDIWLGILALSTLAQAVVIVAGGVILLRRLDRAEARLDALARDAQPLLARLTAALDDLADLAARVRRADAQITAAVDKVATGVDRAKTALALRFWPALGIIRGASAAWRMFRPTRRPALSERRQDALALARFVNEGGSHG